MTNQDMASLPPLPPIVARPKWAAFLHSRGLGIDDLVPVLGRSREYVRSLGLPWNHPGRRTPKAAEIALIEAWSLGEVTAADWEAPPQDGRGGASS